MAAPLFSKEETDAHVQKMRDLEALYRSQALESQAYWSQREALVHARLWEQVRRAQDRAEEFLNALLVNVGSRGHAYVEFGYAFEMSDTAEVRVLCAKYDTPDARRELFTMLTALTEVPKSWARSAFVRFLRGIGKQRGATYRGAGMFGSACGWKEYEVTATCEFIASDRNPYGQVLVSYADVAAEIEEDDPDYEVVDDHARHAATRVERDVAFLQKLCAMLEVRGLASVSALAEKKPKRERTPKQFSSGTIIRLRDLRDLPLPAHVRIAIERKDRSEDAWTDATMEHVVTRIMDSGSYVACIVDSSTQCAHPVDQRWFRKKMLDGATFLGVWSGKTSEKSLRIRFIYRAKNGAW